MASNRRSTAGPASSQRSNSASIMNPYARKKASNDDGKNRQASTKSSTATTRPSQAPFTANNQHQPTNRAAGLRKNFPTSSVAAMEAGTGTTFSQAFGAIEDTDHYRNSVVAAQQQQQSCSNNPERAQQRAYDEAAPKLSDRDHHELLQPHVLYISNKQRGNGVISYIRNVPYEYSPLVPDYIMNKTTCALFLSCKYHSLHPQYVHRRIAELKTDFRLRILLVLVDVEDNANTLLFLNKLAVQQNFTMILAWTEEEAARYLETYKALDGNDATLIQRKEKTNFVEQATEFLSGAQGVNKTDSASLLTQFSSIRAIMAASKDELGLVPGLGQVKVKRLHDAFHKPFSSKRSRERKKQEAETEAIGGERGNHVVDNEGEEKGTIEDGGKQ